MPLQNRVSPTGSIEFSKARGRWLGNRGILHNDQKQIVAPWRHKGWVICRLEFDGLQRKLFSPGDYSELFFLDEATAYAAGHRPCNYCRRDSATAFKKYWWHANALPTDGEKPLLSVIDKRLHSERAIRRGGKVTYTAPLNTLPDGTMFKVGEQTCLKWAGKIWQWGHFGYTPLPIPSVHEADVEVFTPKSIVAALNAGLAVEVHPSAE